jgi:hypothetical protein
MEAKLFLGLSPEAWTAIGAIGAAAAVIATLWQVLAARYQNKKAQTLAACSAYDLNENIYDALQTLWKAREEGSLESDTRKFRPQMNLVLNHLDSIAIGIAQGLYIEAMAWDHLNAIVQYHVKALIDSGYIERADIDRSAYLHLIDMRESWQRAKPRFRDTITWRFWSR